MRGHRASGDFFVLIPLKGQPTIGGVRLVFSLFFLIFASQHDAGNDILSFMCHPETSDFHKEKCFAQYTAEMSPFMRPYLFSLLTAGILFVLWTSMILYSLGHLPKIRRATDSSAREHLCHDFWKMFLLHVGSEAVAVSVTLGLFCYTQKIHFAGTYNCTLMIESVTTCIDVHHRDKSILNIFFIGGLALILLLCLGTVCQAMGNRENFIKELQDLNTPENEAGKERLEILIPNH